MVRTRKGTGTGDDALKAYAVTDKENVNPASAEVSNDADKNAKGLKRKSAEQKASNESKKQKKDASAKANAKGGKSEVRAKEEPAQKATKKSTPTKQTDKKDGKTKKNEAEKPRLTTPDLEFEYDRSQLRDPRATPGRVRMPHYDQFDIPEDLMAEISLKFHIPKPEKPKGRLNSSQKDELIHQEGLMNPLHCFHTDYVCRKKGRNGSPTYDSAGFQLDWKKLNDMEKQNSRATKSSMVDGMERHLDREAREEKEIFKMFFKGNVAPDESAMTMMDHIKDHVSKDLGIPWHQIGPNEVKQWEAKDFEKQDLEKWWHEPNEEESKRMHKMHGGCIYRKDL